MSIESAGNEPGSRKPLLLWLGAGLAAAAALILLVVPGNAAVRVGAVLGLLAVVLIGLSARHGTKTGVVTRATLRMTDERLRVLEAAVRALRADVDRGAVSRAGSPSPRVGWADAADRSDPGAVRSSYAIASSGGYPEVAFGPDFHGADRGGANADVASPPESARSRVSSGPAPLPSPAGRRPVAAGVVRHTETVHVTTRQTIIGPEAGRQGNVYGSANASAGNGWTATAQGGRRSTESDRDWSPGDDRPQRVDDSEQDQMRARPDAEGHEVGVGRRRAALRADGTSAEMRVEDHWAAARQMYQWQQWAGAGSPDERWADSGDVSGRSADARPGHDWSASGRGRSAHFSDAERIERDLSAGWEYSRHPDQPALGGGAWADRSPVSRPRVLAALPAGGFADSWPNGRTEPERERLPVTGPPDDGGSYGLPLADSASPNGSSASRTRQLGFDRSDRRWG